MHIASEKLLMCFLYCHLFIPSTLIILNFYFCCRHKAKRMSFKPDVTADNEERHKASPYIDSVQHRQADCEVGNSESIEMTQVQATNDSQGTEKEQLLAYMYSFCRSSLVVYVFFLKVALACVGL